MASSKAASREKEAKEVLGAATASTELRREVLMETPVWRALKASRSVAEPRM